MISIIKGTIEDIGKDSIVIVTSGGVGYEVKTQTSFLDSQIGSEVNLFTYLKVSEQAMDLYGFKTKEERSFFELLLSVSGVGPKAAMRVLSLGSIEQIQSAIARGDADYLTAVQGMGKKTAERLVVELKSKVSGNAKQESGVNGEILGEVIDGLVAMGYSKEEARAVVEGLDSEGKSTEDLLKMALQQKK